MKIHMVAICGTGMGSLAGLLKAAGHEVRGSDKMFYPPMSERLRAWGIPTQEGFDAAHIDPSADLVIVGNACRKDNPEAQAAFAQGLKVMSFPQALGELFIGRRCSVVVAGTHGKTTTTALLAYLATEAGMDPAFLVGGIPLNYERSFQLGAGDLFIVEGDEYDTAFFDKRPKFVHYRPTIGILTSVEYDHADIYPDMEAYRAAFRTYLGLIPASGVLIACEDDPEVKALLPAAGCRVIRYGLGEGTGYRAKDIKEQADGVAFELVVDGVSRGGLCTPLAGRHNVANTLAALAAAEQLGLSPEKARPLLAGFLGVARRMQVRGIAAGVTVLDDFAHHPTAVRETIHGAKRRYPGARLTAVFEPRSNSSRRKVFRDLYPTAFDEADRVILVPPFNLEQIPADERFDSARVVAQLTQRGIAASLCPDVETVVQALAGELRSGEVVLIMSNGAFGDIHQKLLAALQNRDRA